MKPAGRGWLKDIGLTDEEYAAALNDPAVPIETVERGIGTEPIVVNVGKFDGGNTDVAKYAGFAPSKTNIAAGSTRQGAMSGYKKPDVESEKISQRQTDIKDALQVGVTGAAQGMTEPAEKELAVAKRLGLESDEVRRAQQLDADRRFIDGISRAGLMANAAIGNQEYKDTLPKGIYDAEATARKRFADERDFGLRQGDQALKDSLQASKARQFDQDLEIKRLLAGYKGQEVESKGKKTDAEITEIGAKSDDRSRNTDIRATKTEADIARDKEALRLQAEKNQARLRGRYGKPSGGKDTKGIHNEWEREPGSNVPDSKALTEHRKAVESQEIITGITNEMRSLVKDSSTLERYGPGTANTLLEALKTQAQLEGKEIANLGVLNGPDLKLMEAIISDPTALKNSYKDFERIIKNTEDWVNRRVEARARGAGLRRKGQSSDVAAQTPSESAGPGFTDAKRARLEELRKKKAARDAK